MAVSSEDRLAPCNSRPQVSVKCNSLTIIEIMKEHPKIFLTLFKDLRHYQHFPFYARCIVLKKFTKIREKQVRGVTHHQGGVLV
jgi:hypothetical protein